MGLGALAATFQSLRDDWQSRRVPATSMETMSVRRDIVQRIKDMAPNMLAAMRVAVERVQAFREGGLKKSSVAKRSGLRR